MLAQRCRQWTNITIGWMPRVSRRCMPDKAAGGRGLSWEPRSSKIDPAAVSTARGFKRGEEVGGVTDPLGETWRFYI